MLLDAAADINRENSSGYTPLYVAARYGHVEVMRVLLDLEAEVNRAAPNGATPLWAARYYKHDLAALMLLETGGLG